MGNGSGQGIREGYIPFKGCKTYYRIVGESGDGKLPLLTLHGGPGAAHDYLQSLDEIAESGRAIIYYDQLGCGRSPAPNNRDLWSTDLWLEEIDVVRKHLSLEKLHILGQSWGGMLAMLYALTKPSGVASMIVASSPASMALWELEAKRLMELLPEHMRKALIEGERTGNYDSPAYKEAYDEYYRRHVCGLSPYPDYVDRSFSQMGEVYEVMQGPSEFNCRGKLKSFEITESLGEIEIPTLLTSGTMDEATPLIVKSIFDRIPGCKWELMAGTHLVHVERKDAYNRVVEKFLSDHD